MKYSPIIIGEGLAKHNVSPLHTRVPYSLAQLSCHAAGIVAREFPGEPYPFLHGLLWNSNHLSAGYVPPGLKDYLGTVWADKYETLQEQAHKEVCQDLGISHVISPDHMKALRKANEVALATMVRDFGIFPVESYELDEEPDSKVKALRILAWHEAANHWIEAWNKGYSLLGKIHEESQKPT